MEVGTGGTDQLLPKVLEELGFEASYLLSGRKTETERGVSLNDLPWRSCNSRSKLTPLSLCPLQYSSY